MFIGRKDELKQLEAVYRSDHSNLLVIYGREGIGKTALALNFCANKTYLYYKAVDVSPEEQIRRLDSAFVSAYGEELKAAEDENKRVLIIDEFRSAAQPEINSRILELIADEDKYGRFMVLLLSSSIKWVENDMVACNKELARSITGIIKLNPLSFAETVEWFPKTSASDCVIIRGLLGGIPKYLKLWQENRRVRENMLALFFDPDSPLANEAEHILKLELRELGAYNTILSAVASGRIKLNDIYDYTGFSRAKISVYLKNLIEMDVVEKIYSLTVRNAENTMKGLYRIKDSFLNFYFAFIFPNLSLIEQGQGKTVYNLNAGQKFDEFMRSAFADVCREYLELLSKYKKLGSKYSEWHSWYGKQGILDIVGCDLDRNMLVAMCCYSDNKAGMDQLDEMKNLIEQAGIRPAKLCLFAKSGFDYELSKYAESEGIMTVDLNEL